MLQATQIPNAKPPSYFRTVDSNLSADTDARLVKTLPRVYKDMIWHVMYY